jgi:hypothetical protein
MIFFTNKQEKVIHIAVVNILLYITHCKVRDFRPILRLYYFFLRTFLGSPWWWLRTVAGTCSWFVNWWSCVLTQNACIFSLYVCMYVCFMYVRMYVCIYVCVCMNVCMYVCMYGCVCMYVCTYVCMYVCMYLCMYVCMCVFFYNIYWHDPLHYITCYLQLVLTVVIISFVLLYSSGLFLFYCCYSISCVNVVNLSIIFVYFANAL